MKRERASLPRTKNTVSPTPAPTLSTATSARPTAAVGGDRLDHQQLDPGNRASLCVETTAPTTRARCMVQLGDIDVSTMPTTAASTGLSYAVAMRAELPETIRTVSPVPASTVSTATR